MKINISKRTGSRESGVGSRESGKGNKNSHNSDTDWYYRSWWRVWEIGRDVPSEPLRERIISSTSGRVFFLV
ncbi:MAG: hypothetical protein F6K10_25295 [Moorea sp. SIO2B7]|nr:hypothetical protein [Moorena sp. SIO2B7]